MVAVPLSGLALTAPGLLMINFKTVVMKIVALFVSLFLMSCLDDCRLSKDEIRALIKAETEFKIEDFEILVCEKSIAAGDQSIYINLKLEDRFVDSLSFWIRSSKLFDQNRVDPVNYYPFNETFEGQYKQWYKAPFGYKFVHILDKNLPEYIVCRLDTIRTEFDYRYIIE